jgi:hypothetical protein
MTRRLLMTIDEARAALVASSLELIRVVDCDLRRTTRLLHGNGRTTGLSSRQRRVVASHRMLVRTLAADGLGGVVEEELEGLVSLLDREWKKSLHAKAS